MAYILFAVFLAMAGVLFLSKATTGVGLIGLACLMGIFARLAQADRHHKEGRELVTPEKTNGITGPLWRSGHTGRGTPKDSEGKH